MAKYATGKQTAAGNSPVEVVDAAGDLLDITDVGSITVNSYGTYDGTNFVPVRLDGSTHATNTIDYAHHEVHDGSSFTAEHNAAGGSATKATISFTTPAGTKYFHIVIEARTNVAAVYTLGEGATVTAESGTNYLARNKRRVATMNVSTVLPAGSVPATAGNVTVGGTVTDFGTVLETFQVGSGRVGDNARGVDEWILAPSTVYAIEMESQAATSEVRVSIHWYEHTDKN